MILSLFIITLITAFVSLIIGGKLKWLRWLLFTALLTFMSIRLWSFYGNWGYTEAYRILSLGKIDFTINLGITKLGWFFAFFTTIVNLIISIFSIRKNLHEKDEWGIGVLWMLLAGANIAIFMSLDWITFFIAWEVMTWTSYFIITPGWKKSFKAANYYFLLSMFGTYAMIIGIWWLHSNPAIHTLNIANSITGLAKYWHTSPWSAGTIAFLFVMAFFAKSAVFPFHPWPAEAHAEAPDDFSPYLSGIMIKYGLYGILLFVIPLFIQMQRFSFAGATVNGVPVFSYILAWVGAITAVWGTYKAIVSNDMKRLAAWSTVSNIGYATTAIFILTSNGVTGGIFHIVNHAVFKSAIFIALAAVKYRTHERDMHRLGGLATKMPITFLTFLIGIIAAAGIPPVNGYASKWLIYQALLSGRFPFLTVMIFIASTGAFMYLYRALHSIFLGQLPEKYKNVKEVPVLMQIPMFIGMLLMIGIGVFPGYILKPIGQIVQKMGLTPMRVTNTTMFAYLSNVNALKVFNMFGISFAFAFLLYLIGKPRHHVEPLDNYTAGQNPKDFGMTTEMYHFAYKFYEPFANLFKNIRIGMRYFYDALVRDINLIGKSFASIFESSTMVSSMLFIGGIVTVIIVGWLL
ncbi:NADH-quinone oxidoreductase subunit M [candidate division TA06 bacterium]|uniref:NADH-quinone oxidoreductase subunit M n=1 Tax=candidate division TA06 bacterium TaxID=2250710 RepID=A0A660SBB9_UNCT6|nr:MAG: NADH-quinone oxidoreductase subunit M [candidate division TA06 bacterium]